MPLPKLASAGGAINYSLGQLDEAVGLLMQANAHVTNSAQALANYANEAFSTGTTEIWLLDTRAVITLITLARGENNGQSTN